MTKKDLLRQMETEVEKIPGVDASFSQPIRDNVLESISRSTARSSSRSSAATSKPCARHHKRFSTRLPMCAVSIAPSSTAPAPCRNGASRWIATRRRATGAVADIQDMIETALGGKQATQLWEGERRFAVMVRLSEADRVLAQMHNILISTPSGAHVPLDAVAHFSPPPGP